MTMTVLLLRPLIRYNSLLLRLLPGRPRRRDLLLPEALVLSARASCPAGTSRSGRLDPDGNSSDQSWTD